MKNQADKRRRDLHFTIDVAKSVAISSSLCGYEKGSGVEHLDISYILKLLDIF